MKRLYDSLLFIKHRKGYFVLAAVIMLSFFVFGLLFPNLLDYRSLVPAGYGSNLFLYILLNNLGIALLSMAGGILFGLVPVFLASLNGYVLGMVFSDALDRMGAMEAFIRFFPHGVPEIAAMVAAVGFGLSYSRFFFEKELTARSLLKSFADLFLAVVLPLLFVAAAIETLSLRGLSLGGL